MTWQGIISTEGSEMEVVDHNGDLIDTVANDGGGLGAADVKRVARENMDGEQPTAYNQTLLADMATDDIEIVHDSGDGS